MDLDHHALLARVAVPDLRHTVARTSNLQEDLLMNVRLCRCDHELGFFEIARSSPREVRLVLLPLCVRKVGAFVGVKCQAETTFQGTEVVAEDVRVLRRRQ